MSKSQHAVKQLSAMPLRQSLSPITLLLIEDRIESIQRAMETVRDEEIDRYFPIAAIACLEKASRWAIRSLIEHGEPYATRASKILNDKFEIRDVLDIEAKVVSTAEVIAHLVSISSLEQINSHLSTLMDCKFLDSLGGAKRKWSSIDGDRKANHKLLPYPDRAIKAVEIAFRLRHTYCHELDYEFLFNENEIRFVVSRTLNFTSALLEFIGQELNSGAQTQADMNITGSKLLEISEKKLHGLVKRIEKGMAPGRFRQFSSTHKSWQTYANKTARFEADEFKGGTIAPTIFYSTLTSLTEERCSVLENVIRSEIEFFSSADSKQIKKWAKEAASKKKSSKRLVAEMFSELNKRSD